MQPERSFEACNYACWLFVVIWKGFMMNSRHNFSMRSMSKGPEVTSIDPQKQYFKSSSCGVESGITSSPNLNILFIFLGHSLF